MFYERALYKHGWSRFKQSQYEEGLASFLQLLDRKLPGGPGEESGALSRGEQSLVEDTLRVVSLSFSHMGGAQAIDGYFSGRERRSYEPRIYDSLAAMYLDKGRYTDAANTYNAFVALDPNHVLAPLFQVKTIDAYKKGGFPALVIEGKTEFVERYGPTSDFWQGRPADSVPQVMAEVKNSVSDLARHFHSEAQRNSRPEDFQQAALWYGRYLEFFPKDPKAPEISFLLAETLFDNRQYGKAAEQYERTAYDYPDHPKGAEAAYAGLQAHKKHGETLAGEADRVAWKQKSLASGLRFAERFPARSEERRVGKECRSRWSPYH